MSFWYKVGMWSAIKSGSVKKCNLNSKWKARDHLQQHNYWSPTTTTVPNPRSRPFILKLVSILIFHMQSLTVLSWLLVFQEARTFQWKKKKKNPLLIWSWESHPLKLTKESSWSVPFSNKTASPEGDSLRLEADNATLVRVSVSASAESNAFHCKEFVFRPFEWGPSCR